LLHKFRSGACKSPTGETMGRHQTGYIFESKSGAFHVRYYTTEIVDGQPRRVQKSHLLCRKNNKYYSRKELEKFLRFGYADGPGPVTFRRYTGQEEDVKRRNIWADPPDVLLTSYVMLELILTRTDDLW
jgi:hypothetical protein